MLPVETFSSCFRALVLLGLSFHLLSAERIQILSPSPADELKQHQKLELTFSVDTAASHPWFPYSATPPPGIAPGLGASVDVQFTLIDRDEAYQIPAFYYQEFLDELRGDREWFYPTGHFFWKARFSPPKAGRWRYKIIVQDAAGSSESPEYSFTVVPSHDKGGIRVSKRDNRYFEFSDGTYFTGLGYNLNFDRVSWRNPILDNRTNFRIMEQNGIQLIRIWLSQWAIFGSEWNPWAAQDPALHSLNLPHTGISFKEAFPGSEVSVKLDASVSPCIFVGAWKAPPAVKRNTGYRIRVRFKADGIVGPRNSGQPYGLVAKTGGWLWGDGNYCHDSGTGTTVTQHHSGETEGWGILEGSLSSGERDFLPNFFLVLENVSEGVAYIDHVWIEEDLGNGQFGPNILYKPWMAHHQYFDQRNSYAFDKVLNLAEEHNIYLRPVLLEKNDRLLSGFDDQGNPATADNRWFYGNWESMTKVRWLQEAFWRYAQARWGYSSHIHSWELLNEGDPWNGQHYTLANEFGKFMHCRVFGGIPVRDGSCSANVANDHLISTSFWHSFPKEEFWANPDFRFVDFADVHQYIEANSAVFFDAATAAKQLSQQLGLSAQESLGKPLVRGEVGFVESGSAPPSERILADSEAIWLHNFVWGSITSCGAGESYWYVDDHICNADFDHRDVFAPYYNFISSVPLNEGGYEDANAKVLNKELRAWGQKNCVQGTAHLWIQNKNHTWASVVHGAVQPQSGTVSVTGFEPWRTYSLEIWNTYETEPAKQVVVTKELTSDAEGRLSIQVTKLVGDIAIKIRATRESDLARRAPSSDARRRGRSVGSPSR